MRAILVGAGGMGRAWANNLNQNPSVQLVGWVDVRPGVAADAASERNINLIYAGTSLDNAVQQVDADFVVDVTPPEIHHDVTLKALRYGLPVLGEKPMATSMEQAKRMVKASEESGKLYMVSQSRRYDGGISAFRSLIREKLGQLGILNVDFYIGAHFGGFRDHMDSPLVLDMAIHTFDQARYISGSDPVSVYADEFNTAWSWYRGDASASALFEMTNGVRFNYRGSWCAEGFPTSWEGDWRAIGAQGTAIWEKNREPNAETVTATGSFHSEVEPTSKPIEEVPVGIAGSLHEFLHALATGDTPQGECHDNIKSLAMVFSAIESSRRKERVELAEILA